MTKECENIFSKPLPFNFLAFIIFYRSPLQERKIEEKGAVSFPAGSPTFIILLNFAGDNEMDKKINKLIKDYTKDKNCIIPLEYKSLDHFINDKVVKGTLKHPKEFYLIAKVSLHNVRLNALKQLDFLMNNELNCFYDVVFFLQRFGYNFYIPNTFIKYYKLLDVYDKKEKTEFFKRYNLNSLCYFYDFFQKDELKIIKENIHLNNFVYGTSKSGEEYTLISEDLETPKCFVEPIFNNSVNNFFEKDNFIFKRDLELIKTSFLKTLVLRIFNSTFCSRVFSTYDEQRTYVVDTLTKMCSSYDYFVNVGDNNEKTKETNLIFFLKYFFSVYFFCVMKGNEFKFVNSFTDINVFNSFFKEIKNTLDKLINIKDTHLIDEYLHFTEQIDIASRYKQKKVFLPHPDKTNKDYFYNDENIDKFIFHIDGDNNITTLSREEKDIVRYIASTVKRIAQGYNYSSKELYHILISGCKNSGKSTFIKFLQLMLSGLTREDIINCNNNFNDILSLKNVSLLTFDPMKYIIEKDAARYSLDVYNNPILCVEEQLLIDNKSIDDVGERIKARMTEDNIEIRELYGNPLTVKNSFWYFHCFNGEMPPIYYSQGGDRRYLFLENIFFCDYEKIKQMKNVSALNRLDSKYDKSMLLFYDFIESADVDFCSYSKMKQLKNLAKKQTNKASNDTYIDSFLLENCVMEGGGKLDDFSSRRKVNYFEYIISDFLKDLKQIDINNIKKRSFSLSYLFNVFFKRAAITKYQFATAKSIIKSFIDNNLIYIINRDTKREKYILNIKKCIEKQYIDDKLFPQDIVEEVHTILDNNKDVFFSNNIQNNDNNDDCDNQLFETKKETCYSNDFISMESNEYFIYKFDMSVKNEIEKLLITNNLQNFNALSFDGKNYYFLLKLSSELKEYLTDDNFNIVYNEIAKKLFTFKNKRNNIEKEQKCDFSECLFVNEIKDKTTTKKIFDLNRQISFEDLVNTKFIYKFSSLLFKKKYTPIKMCEELQKNDKFNPTYKNFILSFLQNKPISPLPQDDLYFSNVIGILRLLSKISEETAIRAFDILKSFHPTHIPCDYEHYKRYIYDTKFKTTTPTPHKKQTTATEKNNINQEKNNSIIDQENEQFFRDDSIDNYVDEDSRHNLEAYTNNNTIWDEIDNHYSSLLGAKKMDDFEQTTIFNWELKKLNPARKTFEMTSKLPSPSGNFICVGDMEKNPERNCENYLPHYFCVEYDNLSLKQQLEQYKSITWEKQLKMVTFSGNKSIHMLFSLTKDEMEQLKNELDIEKRRSGFRSFVDQHIKRIGLFGGFDSSVAYDYVRLVRRPNAIRKDAKTNSKEVCQKLLFYKL